MKLQICVLAGPTASGKSAAALALAERFGGEIVNADSMQVYRDLHLLTARPSADDEARAPHHLYGVLPAAEACSAARWLEMAVPVIDDILARGRRALVVGGTGLYLKALVEGLSPMPAIPASTAAHVRDRLESEGSSRLHAELQSRDPAAAAKIAPGDSQRILRALEVLEATGKPLSDWQALPRQSGLDRLSHEFSLVPVRLMPPRAALYRRCDDRFLRMIEAGALEEVRALMEQGLDPRLPAMRALGVPPLMAHLRGEMTLAEAIERAQTATRRYAKRQLTWLRHQFADWPLCDQQDSESILSELITFIQN